MLLRESGLAFEAVRLDMAAGELNKSEYLALNPFGRIPTLVHNNIAVFETIAIAEYLLTNWPDVMPGAHAKPLSRTRMYQWSSVVVSGVHPVIREVFGAVSRGEKTLDEMAQKLQQVMEIFEIVDAHLSSSTFMAGDECSVADYFLVAAGRWGRILPKPTTSFPNIKRLIDLMWQKPAVRETFRVEGIELYR
jgi:glutathione S-transferase